MKQDQAGDDVGGRAAAAIEEADSGPNHQAGVDGDHQSAADRAADDQGPRE